jgi:aspartyl-tRNA(Asn)/glutamyl-tRNA(Gln) amidotransferase subunit A
VYTLPASLAGLPAVSVPTAPAPAEGDRPPLPIGLQIVGPAFEEGRVFGVAAAWERLRDA